MASTAIAGVSLGAYGTTPQQKGWGAPCKAARATVRLSQAAVTVDARLAELVGLIMVECERRGYTFRKADTGAYNCRTIGGSTAWSWHSWAIAIDVNWQSNPFASPLRTDIPVWMRQLFNRYGFAWGGDYSGKKDAMHFEFMGTPQQAHEALLLARRELGGVGGPPIKGLIRTAYDRVLHGLNGATWGFFLGKPKGPEALTFGKDAYWQEFANGAIYAVAGRACVIWGDILKKFWAVGAEAYCGYPLNDETATPDGRGRYNHFDHPDGLSIYWSPETGAHLVRGAIREAWAATGWETGFGFPVTDEAPTADGVGRYTVFQHGTIYWHPELGAHPVYGGIRDAYGPTGNEWGSLGYPIGSEHDAEGGRVQQFQRGSILWVAGKTTVRLNA